jgi:hypothetical protein
MARQWALMIVGFVLTATVSTVTYMASFGYEIVWLLMATIGQIFLIAGLAAWATNVSGVRQELREIRKELELHRPTELTNDLRNESSTHFKSTHS